MKAQRLGFVGIGRMGHGVAKRLLAGGHPLTILAHRNRTGPDDLVARGAAEVGTAAELAHASDVVFTCLPSSAEVERFVLGPSGLEGAFRPGGILVDLTTADPASTRRIGATLEACGCDMIDAPLGRSPREAELGQLSTFVGGRPEVIEGVTPLFNLYADTIVRAGALGSGHTLKLLGNFVSIGTSALVAEAIAAAVALGVDPAKLHEAVTPGATNSRMFQIMMAWALEHDDGGLRSPIRNAAKDIGLYCGIAVQAKAPHGVAASVNEVYASALAAGHGELNMPRLSDILSQGAGSRSAARQVFSP